MKPVLAPRTDIRVALDRAQSLLAQGKVRTACDLLLTTTGAHPLNASVWTGLGVALRYAGKLDAAAQAFERALALNPQAADAEVYLGMIRLAQGQQAIGWSLYRARWRVPHWPEPMRYPEDVLWQGKITHGLRLLLWGEQGYGDLIQFARYAPWIQEQFEAVGASMVFEVPAALSELMRFSWPSMNIECQGRVRGYFDVHLPLMDLPCLWGNRLGKAAGLPYLPLAQPYLSARRDSMVSDCGVVLVPHVEKQTISVGLQWQGRQSHPDDRWRSIPTADLLPLFNVPGIRWVNLQKEFSGDPSWMKNDLESCDQFSDTAMVVQSLDLVISVDSSIAHLAGALGKPVWLLLAKVSDWRWGLNAMNTPWYPSMRIFRQNADESWPDCLERVGEALCETRKKGL